jgi:subtilase family serine protease
MSTANLSVVYLTGSKGLPDYLEFNGETLGVSPQYLSEKYGEKGRDIANEISCDSSGDKGVSSSYFDIDHFDVLDYLQTNNSVVFIRGLDLNGDGEIDDREGEDYLHPVLAALILTSKETSSAVPDLYPEIKVSEKELVDGEDAEVFFMINNPGGPCKENFTASFRVNGNEVSTIPIRMEPSGVYKSKILWPAVKGDHLLEISVDHENKIEESDEKNNNCRLNVRVRSKPELSVSVGNPVKMEEKNTASASAICLSFLSLFGVRRKKPLFLLLLAVLLITAFSGCVEETHAAEKTTYSIPVKITNSGEASARDFDINLYLEGKSIAVLNIQELAGQTSVEEKIRVRALSGEHTLSVKVDEHEKITESDEDNNEFETCCNFT